jgi:hypothetical protein
MQINRTRDQHRHTTQKFHDREEEHERKGEIQKKKITFKPELTSSATDVNVVRGVSWRSGPPGIRSAQHSGNCQHSSIRLTVVLPRPDLIHWHTDTSEQLIATSTIPTERPLLVDEI